MGYRSDVTIMMYPKRKEDFAMLKLFVAENLPDEFEEHEASSGLRYLLLEFEGIKWYEGYEEVDVYTRAFSEWHYKFTESENEEPVFHYEFVRIGEEYEDIVSDRSNNSYMLLNIERNAYIEI